MTAGVVLLLLSLGTAHAQYQGWQHSGSLWILTTPAGANLPDSAAEDGFPLLLRLHEDFFDFGQAQPNGEDIRFCTTSGEALPYQIDEWQPAGGTAAIWVRIPAIKGNARQELRMYWGKAGATSQSSGPAVFNRSNGYLSVWHMHAPLTDEAGTLTSSDAGTAASAGMIGQARHFAGKQGIFCGESITNYPSASNAHTTEAWFRAERPNATIIGWGNEGGGRGSKVRMQFRSPPHIHVDSDFADVKGRSTLAMSQWIQVVHTYADGEGKIYVNGRLDGSARTPLAIKRPARMWIGGWYNNYDFVGDIDEVRISEVARSADWIRLQYENQKPMQTLVGPLVQPGKAFAVSPPQVSLLEGRRAVITAEAGGAQKVYWILRRGGQETVAAVDRLAFTFDAGRVVGDQSLTLQFRAVYAGGVKTKDIPVTIKEDIPEPVFSLKSPVQWDGRATLEVIPEIANLSEMQAKGAGNLAYTWTVSGIAVIKEIVPGKLILKRAQNSGALTVKLALGNGGAETFHATAIEVREPPRDAWLQRAPAEGEKPQDNQFFARDDKNEGTLFYNGTLRETAGAVFLRVFAGNQLYRSETQKPAAGRSYAFAVKLKPGLIKYKVEFGVENDGRERVLHTASNLVCGDAYLIDGQSNAEATDVGKDDPPYTSEWIRSYGSMAGDPAGARLKLWANAVCRDRQGGKAQIGYWGLELARRLLENQRIPVCIINGAVGGSRIDQHQRNPADPEDAATIYGRLLWRVRQARLTHGIRGVLWHQGENDQGADGPTGRYGWETYQQYFVDMSAAWKEDYPNLQHYYLFQIWPRACAMGVDGSDNMLREVQRTLPRLYSRMGIMSTLGIKPPGGCHYPPAGYAEFARLICPLLGRDNYGTAFAKAVTPPDLKQASYTSDKRDAVALEFDQPMLWNDALTSQFHLDGESGKVAAGAASGKVVTLKLTAASTARGITYLDSKSWSPDNLLYGENGIAALTFCDVGISPPAPLPR
jgi:hypothetical protein